MKVRYAEADLNVVPLWFTGTEWADGTAERICREQYAAALEEAEVNPPPPRPKRPSSWEGYATVKEMKQAGYTRSTKGHCRDCGLEIQWWVTPKGKWMPCDPETPTPHWKTCVKAVIE